MFRFLKTLAYSVLGLVCSIFIAVVVINTWVWGATRDRIQSDVMLCEPASIGIVFGTSYGLRGGGANPYYNARLDTAAHLLRLHRIQHLLLSGDNHTRYYNEPVYMWRDLKKRNVATERMTLDYAGFSTFDTLVRAKKVFGLHRVVLITQQWHLPRALFIADEVGLNASGCAAQPSRARLDFNLHVREWLATVGMVGDLYIWGRQPHFLGPKVILPE
ncbi:SanA/YdcF family protein [Phytohalomonas tamaricis]|uniref:SanA/YdcF family protein n=1 Tax=Phytohalomonas tamaricis TaxID=2081032 RepID=UPI000D0B9D83|nr:ElyC/SanA/YdcF family protein [Phytohalomonas tamaricis]